MSVLVSWTAQTAGPLVRGLYPAGLSHLDFDSSPDNEAVGGLLVALYNGDPSPAAMAVFGMTEYTDPYPPIPVIVHRTRVTGRELIALFDSRDEEIWDRVEESGAQAAKDFREAVARNLDRRVSLTASFITDAFALMVPNICSQDDLDFVSLGVEV
jgi:hypothetical protein